MMKAFFCENPAIYPNSTFPELTEDPIQS